mgnify:FL=1
MTPLLNVRTSHRNTSRRRKKEDWGKEIKQKQPEDWDQELKEEEERRLGTTGTTGRDGKENWEGEIQEEERRRAKMRAKGSITVRR